MTQEEAALLGVCPRTFRRYVYQLQALFPQVRITTAEDDLRVWGEDLTAAPGIIDHAASVTRMRPQRPPWTCSQ